MEMQVNVDQLLKESTGAIRVLGFDSSDLVLEDGSRADVEGELRVTKTDRGIWVEGPLSIGVESTCSRCAKPIDYRVDVQVSDEFLPEVDVVTGFRFRHDDVGDADTSSINNQHVLDLSEAIGQYREAALPLAPLCKEDCEGICPECGSDRNGVACECETSSDPRWDKLKELLK